ncbi:DUF998 domain-containing protein [Amycolatopsis suaedae]|uniref:DUF998 domain-containing protein n=1 Tax=Amycolatopsis suaedae TaxID=2510978 RepID=A0A4V2ELS3_9PSEU|nr:DUF998 domain-containing protein [Amycolatopsis suaedae]RZQ62565.1 DUF998 domain-containing protein [Amycolatopsis suaedae]
MSPGVGSARTLGLAVLGAAIVAYSGWLLQFVLPTGLDLLHARPDEASAAGQPYAPVLRGIEVAAGACFVLSAPLLSRLSPAYLLARLSVAASCLFGLLLVTHALVPLDCAESASEVCRQRIEAGQVSGGHRTHRVIDVLLDAIFLSGTATLVLWWPPRWRAFAAAGFAAGLATQVGTLLTTMAGTGALSGLFERLEMATMSAVMTAGLFYLARSVRSPT